MNVALDTNAYSDFMRGVPERVQVVQTAERIHMPLIVLGELRAGFAAGSREDENLETLRTFLASPRVSVLFPDEATTEHYARIFVRLRSEGVAIPTKDLWIAALALQHNLDLCSSDGHFDHVEGLRLCQRCLGERLAQPWNGSSRWLCQKRSTSTTPSASFTR